MPTTHNLDGFNQWMSRPADERFDSLEHLHRHTKRLKDEAVLRTVDLNALHVENENGVLKLGGQNNGNNVEMTSWAFNQMCQRVGIGANFIRQAVKWGHADAAAAILSSGLKQAQHHDASGNELDAIQTLMIDPAGGTPTVLAMNGQNYGRIWSADIVRDMVMPLQRDGWRTPPARPALVDQPGTREATVDDVMVYSDGATEMGLSINVGDLIAPAGLYAGVEDMWVIQVNTDKRIETGSGQGLYRALIFINSEVGAAKYRVIAIGFDSICGNHILWGSKVLGEVAVIHRGSKVTDRATLETARAAQEFLNMPASVEEDAIFSARSLILGHTDVQVIENLFGRRIASKRVLTAAYEKAVEFESDHMSTPNSAWGMASGLTRVSQDDKYANGRAAIDAAASKVLELSF